MTALEMESGFDARIMSLYCGILMAITSGLLVLTCICGLVYVFVITSLGFDLNTSSRPEEYSSIFFSYEVARLLLVNALVILILIISLLELSFYVVLVYGASQRKIGQLKAYFIYGNIKSIIILISSITLYAIMWDIVPGAGALLCCGLNTVFNAVVYMALGNIKRSTVSYSKFDNYIPPIIEELKKKNIEA